MNGGMNIGQQFESAVAHRRAGNLLEAEKAYRQLLAEKPDHADALQLLGVLAGQAGQFAAAAELISRAIAIVPSNPVFHNNLGCAQRDLGQNQQAIATFRRAIELKGDYAEAYNNLAIVLRRNDQLAEALAALEAAVRLKPAFAEAHNNLGSALTEFRQYDQAIAQFNEAIRLKPNYADPYYNLAAALLKKGRLDQAIAAGQQALVLNPRFAPAHNNLAIALRDKGRLDEAVSHYQRAIELLPDYTDAHSNLGAAYLLMGRLAESIACFRQALRLSPELVSPLDNLVYMLHFHPAYDAEMILREHQKWNACFAEPLKSLIQPHMNDRRPDRVLRIGYVSPNFHEHPVGRFILPLLAAHNHEQFAIYCYSDCSRPDRFTALHRKHASQWRDTEGLTDDELAQMIREDQIDILVDLTMHMDANRMLVFARKPAPVQVTYLAYCSTTGLQTMDYRLTDRHLDPPGETDQFYTEKSVRLPETYWCYPNQEISADIVPLPAQAAGFVTFGCFNNFCKVSDDALAAWAALMRSVPGSRLVLHAQEGSHRQRMVNFLAEHGIEAGRVSFVRKTSLHDYFKQYEKIDIALDPFPCNGGTTTCDALWMGVPVVTLRGRTAVGRGGVSILNNIGEPSLIAQTTEEYVAIAAELAGNLPRLMELRQMLRSRMLASPLMDAQRFAGHVEAAYRQMWRDWCKKL